MKIKAVLILIAMTLAVGAHDKSLILQDDFSQEMKNWYVEGGRRVEVKEGRLLIDADPEKPEKGGLAGGTCTVWHRTELTGDLRIEFDAFIEHSHSGKNNINFFLFYTMPNGDNPEKSTADRKYAVYSDYHKMTGYIFTFVNDLTKGEQGRVRIRRCPGFHLLSGIYTYHSKSEHLYRIAIVKKGCQLQYYIDGELRLTAEDENPLNQGYFGFRTFQTRFWVDNLTIHRLD